MMEELDVGMGNPSWECLMSDPEEHHRISKEIFAPDIISRHL
jgi:hypothetical protein